MFSSLRSFCFLLVRRPPKSTLFPTRRSSDLGPLRPLRGRGRPGPRMHDARRGGLGQRTGQRLPARERSEEHTSELQSRLHLVCRLLLEKKKINNTTTNSVLHTRCKSSELKSQ